MKTLLCSELGGPCSHKVSGATFQEIGQACRMHVMERMQAGDEPHIKAAAKMRDAAPEQQRAWMAEWQRKFDAAAG